PAERGKQPPRDPPGAVPVVRELRRFEGHTDVVWDVAFSPDGRRALSGSGSRFVDGRWTPGADRTVRLWDTGSGRQLWQREMRRAKVTGVAFAADGRAALATSHQQVAARWDLETGAKLSGCAGESGIPFYCVAYGGNGRRALSAGLDRVLRW